MKIAIISVSICGKKIAQKLCKKLEQDPTIMYVKIFHQDTKNTLNSVFSQYDAIICIMATGIIVRSLCDLIKSKASDPAILAIDDKGINVISLLSGHLGGANNLTLKVSNILNSNPVITTSTDINGLIGIDELARKYHWKLMDTEKILNFNRFILNGEKIHILSQNSLKYLAYDNKIKKSYLIIDNIFNIFEYVYNNSVLSENENINKILLKMEKNDILAFHNDDFLIIKPKKLVIGIGSRKGISKNRIINSINETAKILNLNVDRFDYIATAEVKKNEKGILDASVQLKIPLEIISMENIKNFESDQIHSSSSFVNKTFGVKGICEPVSLIKAGNNSKLIFKKTVFNGITIAVSVSI